MFLQLKSNIIYPPLIWENFTSVGMYTYLPNDFDHQSGGEARPSRLSNFSFSHWAIASALAFFSASHLCRARASSRRQFRQMDRGSVSLACRKCHWSGAQSHPVCCASTHRTGGPCRAKPTQSLREHVYFVWLHIGVRDGGWELGSGLVMA